MSKSTDSSEIRERSQIENPFNSAETGIPSESPRVTKHGLTTAGLEEQPLDMLSALVHEKKIQEEDRRRHGETGELHFFMADIFESLNMGRSEAAGFLESENESRDDREDYLEASAELVGIEGVNFVRSEDIFSHRGFYEIAEDIVSDALDISTAESVETGYPSLASAKRDVESVLPKSVIADGMTAESALGLFEEMYDVDIPDSLYSVTDQFEDNTGEEMRAAHWYGIFEVAATEWMRREQGINNKSGHDKENIYDKKINELIGTSRYNQPASLGSQVKNAGTRIPYTVWPGREDSRLLLSDSQSDIENKIGGAETNFAVTTTEGLPGYIWNPVLEKGFVAAEILSEQGRALEVDDEVLESAEDVLEYSLNIELESYSIEDVAQVTLEEPYSNQGVVSEAVDQNAIGDIKDALPEAYGQINRQIRGKMSS